MWLHAGEPLFDGYHALTPGAVGHGGTPATPGHESEIDVPHDKGDEHLLLIDRKLVEAGLLLLDTTWHGHDARFCNLRMFRETCVHAENFMAHNIEVKVEKDGESAGQFDAACIHVRQSTGARCAVVIVIDGHSGSGYSVVGPIEAQILLPDILQQMANTLRAQLAKNLQ